MFQPIHGKLTDSPFLLEYETPRTAFGIGTAMTGQHRLAIDDEENLRQVLASVVLNVVVHTDAPGSTKAQPSRSHFCSWPLADTLPSPSIDHTVPMAELTVVNEQLHLELSTWEKVGALQRNDLVFPMASIASVARVDNARKPIRGVRLPGTGWPGRVALGSWRTRRTVDFVAVYRNDAGYLVEFDGQRFDRLIVSSPPLPELDALT